MPQAFDTSPRVAAAHAQLYRDIGPATLRDLAAAGVRQRHPEYDDERVLKEVLAVFYGRRDMSP